MLAGRRVSPDHAFVAALKSGRNIDAHGKGTVSKSAADQALRNLNEAGATQVEQALVVQRYLDSQDAAGLSSRAREALLAFVSQHGAAPTGERATEVRRAAQGRQAALQVGGKAAQGKVLRLLKQSSTVEERRERVAKVTAWLDVADADLAQAGARLASLATGAPIKMAGKSGGAGASRKDAQQARGELDALLKSARPGDVRQGDVEQVRQWLAQPMPDRGIKGAAPELSPVRTDALRQAFGKLDLAGTLSWSPGGVVDNHLGVRFARVELMRERHPDGFTFTAFLPVGALAPGAPLKDPNQVNEFYVERTGGVAGLTFSVGPLRS